MLTFAALALTATAFVVLAVALRRRHLGQPMNPRKPPRCATDAERIAYLERRVRRDGRTSHMLYVVVIAGLAFTGYSVANYAKLTKSTRNIARDNQQIISQQATRALARCATISAVIYAGREVILEGGGQGLATAYQQSLEKLGAPTVKERQSAAEAAAKQYGTTIREQVKKITGNPAPPVAKDGSIDCSALAPSDPKTP